MSTPWTELVGDLADLCCDLGAGRPVPASVLVLAPDGALVSVPASLVPAAVNLDDEDDFDDEDSDLDDDDDDSFIDDDDSDLDDDEDEFLDDEFLDDEDEDDDFDSDLDDDDDDSDLD